MKKLIVLIVLVLILISCEKQEYHIALRYPTFSTHIPTDSGLVNEILYFTLKIENALDNEYEISIISSDELDIYCGKSKLPTNGDWQSFSSIERFSITSPIAKKVEFTIQIKDSSGNVSEKSTISMSFFSTLETQMEIIHSEKIINLKEDELVPIEITASNAAHEDNYILSFTITKGKGLIYTEEGISNDKPIIIEPNKPTQLGFMPSALGEYIIKFTLKNPITDQVITESIYFKVVKRIKISHLITTDLVEVVGEGEYDKEGVEITFKLNNTQDEVGYNYNVVSWEVIDDNSIMSSQNEYTFQLKYDSPTEYRLNAQNIVHLHKGQLDAEPSAESKYGLYTDYFVDEAIRFEYIKQYYIYTSSSDRFISEYEIFCLLNKGKDWAGYFIYVNREPTIYIPLDKHPTFTYNERDRCLSSAKTKLYLTNVGFVQVK